MHLQSHQVRGFTLLSPTLGFMVLFLALPIVILLVLSFWTQTYIDFNKTFSLANYQKFFSRPIYSFLLGKSIVISLCVTIATVLIAYPMAYFLAFRTQGNKLFWIVLVTLPFWTSYLLRVFAWKIILGYNGVINSGFISLGLIKEPLLFLLYNPGAVIITLAHAWGAFAILPIYVSLEKIDRSLLEAATDLGDSLVSRFFRITLPLSMPGVIAATIFVFIPTVGDYVTPNLVGGTNGIMIGNIIQSQFGKANNWPMGAALALISMAAIAIIVLLYLWCIKLLKKRI
ncbi:MAG TPA: ABC transporter permease [Gammaproteobacteria bacterium]|nr:ABC transporter permease [Gammaproteobacteria bacterium]HIN16414.1 ABC transporter permease [Gammaproteobacteria bacterium]